VQISNNQKKYSEQATFGTRFASILTINNTGFILSKELHQLNEPCLASNLT